MGRCSLDGRQHEHAKNRWKNVLRRWRGGSGCLGACCCCADNCATDLNLSANCDFAGRTDPL